jgi:hypothetical protein
MKRLLPVLMGFVVLLLSSTEGWSVDFQKGLDAYNKKDYATALREWEPLAQQGNADAQYNLGQMFRRGLGVPQDYKTAVTWYRRAAEQGYASAQFNLGLMYDEGLGVPQDYKTAVKWYSRAADQGIAQAQSNLGLMYSEGQGVPQDYKTAVKWYSRAAEQEHAKAQFNLGVMYYKGQGVIKNNVLAHMWFNISASNENKGAEKIRERIAKQMTPSQLEKAQELARNFVSKKKSDPVVIAKKPSPTVIGTSEKTPKIKPKRNISRSPSVIGTSEKTPKIKPKRNISRSPSVIGTSEKTPKVKPKRKPSPSVVAKVPPKKTKPEPPAQSISASGFFVSKLGHIITNEHVVRNCKSVTVGDNSNKQSPANVEEKDKRKDLALLKLSTLTMASAETKSLIEKLGIKVVPLASDGLLRSEDVELGERIMVSGYPYGDIFSNTIKVTGGMVSAVRGMGDDSSQFTMDAAVQKGSSGGPIYDENGNVVGVVVAKLDRAKVAKRIGSMPENMNFGIKASTVRQFLNASGLPTKWSKRSKSISTKEIAKIAENQTLMVVCHQ